jgi:hypothetical protein
MERSNERGPWLSGVRIRKVRAVSIGDKMIEESAEDTSVSINVVVGETAVRMSDATGLALPSSGSAKIADRRLWMKVFRVGSNSEYMNVAFEAFQTDVGPLLDHSCERTSRSEDGFLMASLCFGSEDDGGI